MKILFDASSLVSPLSGIGRYAQELARRLPEENGVENVVFLDQGRVLAEFDPEIVKPQPREGGIRPMLRKVLPYEATLGPYRRYRARQLASRLQQFSGHIYFSPNFTLPPISNPTAATLHDLSVFHLPEFHPRDRVNFLRDQITHTVKTADCLVTDSEFVRQELLNLFSLPEERVVTIPLGVNTSYRPRQREELSDCMTRFGLNAGKYLLSVGTIEPRKNLGRLVEAYGRLHADIRSAYPLVIVGAYGWASERLMEDIRQRHGDGDIIYLDYVPEADLPYLYAGAALFCYFSLYEGFGLPVLEAMSSGIPVLCSNNSALPELCPDGCALVDPNDVDAIARAMAGALDDPDWLREAGRAGRSRSLAYRWDSTTTMLVSVLGALS